MLEELADRLSQTMDLKSISIEKLYDELVSFFSETQGEFIIRRHSELKEAGHSNLEIFDQIQKELVVHLFRGESISERKIKRIIYKEV